MLTAAAGGRPVLWNSAREAGGDGQNRQTTRQRCREESNQQIATRQGNVKGKRAGGAGIRQFMYEHCHIVRSQSDLVVAQFQRCGKGVSTEDSGTLRKKLLCLHLLTWETSWRFRWRLT
jgi:hypothetical protein